MGCAVAGSYCAAAAKKTAVVAAVAAEAVAEVATLEQKMVRAAARPELPICATKWRRDPPTSSNPRISHFPARLHRPDPAPLSDL